MGYPVIKDFATRLGQALMVIPGNKTNILTSLDEVKFYHCGCQDSNLALGLTTGSHMDLSKLEFSLPLKKSWCAQYPLV